MVKRIQEANNHLVHLRRESSEGAVLISCLPTWPILEAGISAEKCFHHWPAGKSMEHFLDWTWMWKGPTHGAWWPLWEGASDCIRRLGKPWRASLPVCKHRSLWSVLHSGPCVECLPLFLFVVDWRLSDGTNPFLPGLFLVMELCHSSKEADYSSCLWSFGLRSKLLERMGPEMNLRVYLHISLHHPFTL